jgi:hypothetical protein
MAGRPGRTHAHEGLSLAGPAGGQKGIEQEVTEKRRKTESLRKTTQEFAESRGRRVSKRNREEIKGTGVSCVPFFPFTLQCYGTQ